jgi:hypothetical protein
VRLDHISFELVIHSCCCDICMQCEGH